MFHLSKRKGKEMIKRSIYLAVLILLALSAAVYSAYWETSYVKVGAISPRLSPDSGRLLFKFDLPEGLANSTIDYAQLIFTATPDTGQGHVCLMGIFPLTEKWEPSALSWSEGWTEQGGDYLDSIYSVSMIRLSEDKLTRVDITDIVQLWVEGTLANHGLIVMPLEDSGRFLKLHPTPGLDLGAKAKVRIWYTPGERE